MIHLAVNVDEFRRATRQPSEVPPPPLPSSSSSPPTQSNSAIDTTEDSVGDESRSPLFGLGDHDLGALDVPIFFSLVVVSFVVVLWMPLSGWMKLVFGSDLRSSVKDLQAMDDDDDGDGDEISVQESFSSAATILKPHVRTVAGDARRLDPRQQEGLGARKGSFGEGGEAEAAQSGGDSERVPLESSTLGAAGEITACGSSGSTLLPISKAFIQERIEQSSRNNSWPVAPPLAQDCSLTKAVRGGRMMGQYLQQSRRTASQSDLGLGMSPLLPAAPLPTYSAASLPRITVNGTEYDRVFEQLACKTLRNGGHDRGELAGDVDDDDDDEEEEEEECGIETLCPVSLEGLVYDIDDGMAGGEEGDREMEVALADSSEIRGIGSMGPLPSYLIHQKDANHSSSVCGHRTEGSADHALRGSLPAREKDRTRFYPRDQGRQQPTSSRHPAMATALSLPPVPKAAPPKLPPSPAVKTVVVI
ncbi:hypothetical protein EC968_004521 [Mortierella alpina]|nr:hypothetical protein EC968_004521 [Mortierella alpina]